jgi:hypothetical protein
MHLNSSSKLTWTSILMWTRLVIQRERGRAIFLGTEERQGRHGWTTAAAPADEPGLAVDGKWGKRERGVRASDSPTHLGQRWRTEARLLRRVDRGGGCCARRRWRARKGEGWEGADLVDMVPTKLTPGALAPARGPRVGGAARAAHPVPSRLPRVEHDCVASGRPGAGAKIEHGGPPWPAGAGARFWTQYPPWPARRAPGGGGTASPTAGSSRG